MPPVTKEYWQWLAVAGVWVVACLIVTMISASHRIQGYYIEQSLDTSCIKASVDWDVDKRVYCSQDLSQLVSTVERLNQTLK